MSKKPPTQPQLSKTELINILDAAPVGMIVSRLDGSFEYVNPALINMLGYSEKDIYDPELIVTHPDDLDINRQIRKQLLQEPNKTVVMEKRYLHKNGKAILGLLSMIALKDSQGTVKRFLSQVIDVEYRKKMEKSADLFRSMINASRDAMFIIDPDTSRILDANTEGCSSLGYSYEEILRLNITDIEITLQNTADWKIHIGQLRQKKYMLVLGERRHKQGHTFPVEMSVSYLVQDEFEYLLAIVRDITERKKSEALIWNQANFDQLTRLPNRNMLYDRLEHAIKKAQRSATKIALLCLDLDKFKDVNDTLGHDVGDALLQEASRRLLDCVREIDTVARLGGDEFCVVIEQVDDIAHIDRIASLILDVLLKPFMLGVNKAFISASIGIAFYPNDASDVDGLLKKSDQAMYFAKANGRNCFQYFTENMQIKALDRMQLGRDLFDALSDQQFFIEYQPIVSLKDNKVYKAEALLRWRHPQRGLVGPEKFIAIAEENGTIGRIGEWVLSEVIKLANYWRQHYRDDFQISVNASPLQFRDGSTQIHEWLNQMTVSGLSGAAIAIEITEGLIMDTTQGVTDKLLLLRDAGVQVALDDFGTGYSSLAYLQRLDIDYLKIDRSFIENLHSGSNEEALCEAIIAMAHRLNLKVVAEGVETREQCELLQKAGCDYGQGFYFSAAITSSIFEDLFFKN
jgi:diguanylate cyclase (GGDEF)-like protein/PAS domain S-box-containing protein